MTASRQTRLKMRKGFVAAPLTYRVLMVQQFTDEDRKIISKGLIKATTPAKAKELLPGPDNAKLPQKERSKWMLRSVSQIGNFDVQILMYKALEVAIFFRRQTSVVTPEPEDPAPEGYIENDDDIWARMDLFSKSPRQLVGSVREELAEKDAEIARLTFEVESQAKLIEGDAKTIKSLRTQLQAAQTKPSKPIKLGRKNKV